MKLHELKERLVKKKIDPFYIFTGDETAVMQIYIDKIADIMNTKPKRIDSVGEIYSKLQNNSLMNKPNCYIIRDDKEYLSQEKIWEGLSTGAAQGDNVIILIYTSLDQRTKFYKQHSDQLTVFEKLVPEVLAKYLRKDFGMDPKEGVILAEMCECSYHRVLLEADKLKHLAAANDCSIEEAFHLAVENKLIYTPPKDEIFAFIDAVCKRQVITSFNLLEALKLRGESPLGAISLLYTNFRSMLLVQSAGSGDITNRTGLTAWQVKLAKEKGHNYSIGELVRILRTVRETEKGIKTGMIETNLALDYILANVL